MEILEKPHAFVKNQMATGSHTPSFTSALLEKGNLTPEEEFNVKWSALSLYTGGADTVNFHSASRIIIDLTHGVHHTH